MPSNVPRPALAANPRGSTDPSSEAFRRPETRFAHRPHTRLLKHPVRRERARESKEKPARFRRSRLQQLDGLAVRSVSIGCGPGFFACEECGSIGQPLRGDQSLQSSQPVFVVARTVVGFTTSGSDLELVGQRGRPLLPRELALLGELDGERERLRLPRFGEHRPALVTRQPREIGELLGSAGLRSGSLKVVVPHVDVNRIARRGEWSPQLAGGEAHRVHVLTFFTLRVRVRVREDVHAVVASDDPDLASRVARQTRVANRVHIARAHTLSHFEQRSHRRLVARGNAAGHPAG